MAQDYDEKKGPDDLKREKRYLELRYDELRAYTEEVVRQLNELRQGRIRIESLNIKYDIPEEAISYHHWRNRIYIFIAASLIGLIAVGFAKICDGASGLFIQLFTVEPLIPFVLTPFGFLFIRWFTSKYFSGAEGSGIPQVIASMNGADGSKLLGFRAGVGKILGTGMALMCGASVGREGPTVQLGAIILGHFTKIIKIPVRYSQRSLFLAGGAAGVSAAFNTPIAGIVFAIEELGKSFYERETSVLLMSIVVSGLCALSLSGPYFYFGATQVAVLGWDQLFAVPIGLFSGVAGGLFALALTRGSMWMAKCSQRQIYTLTFFFGVAIAAIGYWTHGATFGTGYEEAKAILTAEKHVANYSLLKFVVTVLSYLSGIPGGIFAPTLSIGAGIGSWFVEIFQAGHQQAFVLLGMVSFFSGVIRSPITAVIIVSEMTHNHSLLLPLLAASLSAYGAARLISRESLYQTFAERYLGPMVPAAEESSNNSKNAPI